MTSIVKKQLYCIKLLDSEILTEFVIFIHFTSELKTCICIFSYDPRSMSADLWASFDFAKPFKWYIFCQGTDLSQKLNKM